MAQEGITGYVVTERNFLNGTKRPVIIITRKNPKRSFEMMEWR
jgi:hypothetical protein